MTRHGRTGSEAYFQVRLFARRGLHGTLSCFVDYVKLPSMRLWIA